MYYGLTEYKETTGYEKMIVEKVYNKLEGETNPDVFLEEIHQELCINLTKENSEVLISIKEIVEQLMNDNGIEKGGFSCLEEFLNDYFFEAFNKIMYRCHLYYIFLCCTVPEMTKYEKMAVEKVFAKSQREGNCCVNELEVWEELIKVPDIFIELIRETSIQFIEDDGLKKSIRELDNDTVMLYIQIGDELVFHEGICREDFHDLSDDMYDLVKCIANNFIFASVAIASRCSYYYHDLWGYDSFIY